MWVGQSGSPFQFNTWARFFPQDWNQDCRCMSWDLAMCARRRGHLLNGIPGCLFIQLFIWPQHTWPQVLALLALWDYTIILIVLLPPLTYGFVRLSSLIGTELCSSCFLYFKVSCQGQHYSGNPCSQPCLVLKPTPHKMSQQCDQYPTLCSSPDQTSDQLLYLWCPMCP